LVGKPEGKKHLSELGVDGRVIVESILRDIEREDRDWIYLAEDGDQ
jgi:hypothetical protein